MGVQVRLVVGDPGTCLRSTKSRGSSDLRASPRGQRAEGGSQTLGNPEVGQPRLAGHAPTHKGGTCARVGPVAVLGVGARRKGGLSAGPAP